MTTKRLGNAASIYRVRVGRTHRANSGDPPSLIFPSYRGFKLACLAGEIEAAKRAVDQYWSDRYNLAANPAEKVLALMDERSQRFQPREWRGSGEAGPEGEGQRTAPLGRDTTRST